MTPAQRRWVFGLAVAGLIAFYLWGLSGLPGFGHYPGPYGFAILYRAVHQTNATGIVSAVNFDYRGFDTVGEEFILFAAAAGTASCCAGCAASASGPRSTRPPIARCPPPAGRSGW